jgi:hypothetical protein
VEMKRRCSELSNSNLKPVGLYGPTGIPNKLLYDRN